VKGIRRRLGPRSADERARGRYGVSGDSWPRCASEAARSRSLILEKIAPISTGPAYLVEEYPTADALEVERSRLT